MFIVRRGSSTEAVSWGFMAKSCSIFDKDLRADKKNLSEQHKKRRGGDLAESLGTVCCYVSKAMCPLIYQWPNTGLIIALYNRAVKMIKACCFALYCSPAAFAP